MPGNVASRSATASASWATVGLPSVATVTPRQDHPRLAHEGRLLPPSMRLSVNPHPPILPTFSRPARTFHADGLRPISYASLSSLSTALFSIAACLAMEAAVSLVPIPRSPRSHLSVRAVNSNSPPHCVPFRGGASTIPDPENVGVRASSLGDLLSTGFAPAPDRTPGQPSIRVGPATAPCTLYRVRL